MMEAWERDFIESIAKSADGIMRKCLEKALKEAATDKGISWAPFATALKTRAKLKAVYEAVCEEQEKRAMITDTDRVNWIESKRHKIAEICTEVGELVQCADGARCSVREFVDSRMEKRPPRGEVFHFDDLTAVKAPFNRLDADTQARLKALPDEVVQYFSYGRWYAPIIDRSSWNKDIYRQDPAWVDKSGWPEKPEGIVEWGGKRWRVKGDAPVLAIGIDKGTQYFLDFHSTPVSTMISSSDYDCGQLRWLAEEVPEESCWVECGVRVSNHGTWMVYVTKVPHVQCDCLALHKAMGLKGFGGIRYEGFRTQWFSGWHLAVNGDGSPAAPEAVRFWVDRT